MIDMKSNMLPLCSGGQAVNIKFTSQGAVGDNPAHSCRGYYYYVIFFFLNEF